MGEPARKQMEVYRGQPMESEDQQERQLPALPQSAHQPIQLQTMDDVIRLGSVLFESGYFKDVKDTAQAIVKVLAGAELGIPPIAAMRGVHAFDGGTSLHYSVVAANIKKSGRYDYRVLESTPERAEIEFFEHGQSLGTASFSFAEAKKITFYTKGGRKPLSSKDNWQNYPEDMCFGRALTRGARRYCPDVFHGPVYTPEEIGADENEIVIEPRKPDLKPAKSAPARSKPKPKPKPKSKPSGSRGAGDFDVAKVSANPQAYDDLPFGDEATAPEEEVDEVTGEVVGPKPSAEKMREFHALGTRLFQDHWDERRADLVRRVTVARTTSSKKLLAHEMDEALAKLREAHHTQLSKIKEANRKEMLEADDEEKAFEICQKRIDKLLFYDQAKEEAMQALMRARLARRRQAEGEEMTPGEQSEALYGGLSEETTGRMQTISREQYRELARAIDAAGLTTTGKQQVLLDYGVAALTELSAAAAQMVLSDLQDEQEVVGFNKRGILYGIERTVDRAKSIKVLDDLLEGWTRQINETFASDKETRRETMNRLKELAESRRKALSNKSK